MKAALVLAAPLTAGIASADVTVNTTADSDADDLQCSLREAIVAANTNADHQGCTWTAAIVDKITFDLGTGTPVITVNARTCLDDGADGDRRRDGRRRGSHPERRRPLARSRFGSSSGRAHQNLSSTAHASEILLSAAARWWSPATARDRRDRHVIVAGSGRGSRSARLLVRHVGRASDRRRVGRCGA
jgi:CSLREA domain-containing protein